MFRCIQRLNSLIRPVNKYHVALISTLFIISGFILSATVFIILNSEDMAANNASLEFLANTTLEKLDGSQQTFLAGELWKEKPCVIMAVRRAG